jgi:hypothetical protein
MNIALHKRTLSPVRLVLSIRNFLKFVNASLLGLKFRANHVEITPEVNFLR